MCCDCSISVFQISQQYYIYKKVLIWLANPNDSIDNFVLKIDKLIQMQMQSIVSII